MEPGDLVPSEAVKTVAAEHAVAAGRVEPAWNDLREQRVLQRIQTGLTAAPAPSRARWAFAAVAAVLLAVVGWAVLRGRSAAPRPEVASAAAASSSQAEAQVALDDGSVVRLVADARVTVHEQTETVVRLTQTKGLARYEVAHRPTRAFVVAVADAEVEVHGTVFTVELLTKTVRVRVVEGQVTVRGDGRAVKLAAGESLEVTALRAPAASSEPSTSTIAALPTPPPAPVASVSAKPKSSVDALLSGVDAARAEGRLDDAAELLRTLIAQHPGDPRVASAHFTLGRVERGRGRHAAAAAAFAKVTGPLAEDALAEEATSWKAAGDPARARAAAKRYLTLHPKGLHAQRMLTLAE